jgi:hypothetical protein
LLDTLADDVELQREVINGDLPSGIGREIPALSQWRRLPAT